MSEESIFADVLELAPREQARFLDQVCSDNPELRRRLEALLRSHRKAGADFLEPLKLDSIAPPAEASSIQVGTEGSRIGRYTLLEQIGEGGFGVVYRAEQQEPVRRKVALKIIKPGMDTREVVARFEAERQALALMDHPNIASVLDGGATDSGHPYFVMELVEGPPITDYCDQHRLSTEARLRLFVSVCHAVQHAHQKGVIHRDIKPSNILVALHDQECVPKVIDFGVAKATDQELTQRTLCTQYGQIIGTPQYMSPEQAGMNSQDVDTRTDIYSLGVLLYELLTGRTPIDLKRIRSASLDQVRRIICDEEFRRPSTRLSGLGAEVSEVAELRATQPANLRKLLRGDLDWIVMKAIDKDRSRRYASANDLADDIQRFLNCEAVEARPPTLAYKLRKLIRRNRAPLAWIGALAGVVVLAVAVGGAILAESRRSQQAAALVEQLVTAEIQEVPAIIQELAPHRSRVEARLRQVFQDAERNGSERQRLHAALALAPTDENAATYLARRLLDSSPKQVMIIRDALHPRRESVIDSLWTTLRDERLESGARLRAACALAVYDPGNRDGWEEAAPNIAAYLVAEDSLALSVWLDGLRPISERLLDPLAGLFRAADDGFGRRPKAAEILALYGAERPQLLADLLMDADDSQFRTLFPVLAPYGKASAALLNDELSRGLPSEPAERERLNRRRANAAIALFRMGDRGPVWSLLRHSPEPEVRSRLIHRLPRFGADAKVLAERLDTETDVSVRRALVLCLGEYPVTPAWLDDYRPLVSRLQAEYLENPDPGMHAAAEWTLRRWGKLIDPPPPGFPLVEKERLLRLLPLKQDVEAAQAAVSQSERDAPQRQQAWERALRDEFNEASAAASEGLAVHLELDEIDGDEAEVAVGRVDRSSKGLVKDVVGGLLSSVYPRIAPGVVGNAVQLDGAAYLDADADFSPATHDPFTMGCWFLSEVERSAAVVSQWDPHGGRGFELSLEYGHLRAQFVHGPDDLLQVVTRDPLPDGWRHAVVVYDGSARAAGVLIYIDGRPTPVVIAKDALSGSIQTDFPLRIGTQFTNEPFEGFVDDVRLYRRQLAPEEVELIYRLGLAAVPRVPLHERTSEQDALLTRAFAAQDEVLLNRQSKLAAARAALREARWTGGRRWYRNSQGQTMVVIPAETFIRGSRLTESDRQPDERPVRVRIGRTFALAAKEITVEEFRRFREGYVFDSRADSAQSAVAWYDAAAYCNWLSEQDGIPPDQWCYEPNGANQYRSGMRPRPGYLKLSGYRLPSDAEWEYACRAGAATARSYGDTVDLLDRYAWYLANANYNAALVGRLKPNDFGLFDMHGNVIEWCHDRAPIPGGGLDEPEIEDRPDEEPIAGDDVRVMRGGAFQDPPRFVRAADRYRELPAHRQYYFVGFRPARTINDAAGLEEEPRNSTAKPRPAKATVDESQR